MSRIFTGILGVVAVSLSFGAVQLASGSDLHRLRQSAASALKTQTISVRVDGLADTSILVRVPVARKEASSAPAPVVSTKPMARTVACEPVVSVLTEVAKQLQPGRCVT